MMRDGDSNEDVGRFEGRFERRFEGRLRSVERRALPAGWRDEVLGNACGEAALTGERPGVVVRLWRAVPKAVALPVAACWVAIGVLELTMPGGAAEGVEGAAVAVGVPDSEAVEREMFVSWVVAKRQLGEEVGTGEDAL